MRIRFSVFLLILVLAFGTFGYAFCAVNDAADQVEFLTKHFDGDISAAEGLEITLKSTYEDHLHWETVFSPAGQKAESTFRFTQSPLYEPWHPAYRVELNTAFTLGYAADCRLPAGEHCVIPPGGWPEHPGSKRGAVCTGGETLRDFRSLLTLGIPGRVDRKATL